MNLKSDAKRLVQLFLNKSTQEVINEETLKDAINFALILANESQKCCYLYDHKIKYESDDTKFLHDCHYKLYWEEIKEELMNIKTD